MSDQRGGGVPRGDIPTAVPWKDTSRPIAFWLSQFRECVRKLANQQQSDATKSPPPYDLGGPTCSFRGIGVHSLDAREALQLAGRLRPDLAGGCGVGIVMGLSPLPGPARLPFEFRHILRSCLAIPAESSRDLQQVDQPNAPRPLPLCKRLQSAQRRSLQCGIAQWLPCLPANIPAELPEKRTTRWLRQLPRQ